MKFPLLLWVATFVAAPLLVAAELANERFAIELPPGWRESKSRWTNLTPSEEPLRHPSLFLHSADCTAVAAMSSKTPGFTAETAALTYAHYSKSQGLRERRFSECGGRTGVGIERTYSTRETTNCSWVFAFELGDEIAVLMAITGDKNEENTGQKMNRSQDALVSMVRSWKVIYPASDKLSNDVGSVSQLTGGTDRAGAIEQRIAQEREMQEEMRAHKGEEDQPTLNATDLEWGKVQLIGRLGIPMGQLVELEATVVLLPDDPVRRGANVQWYGLRVDKINGASVAGVVTPFHVIRDGPFSPLAVNESDLDFAIARLMDPIPFNSIHAEGTDEKPTPISREDAEALRLGYLGSRHRMLGYELGGFYGHPEMPEAYKDVYIGPAGMYFGLHLMAFRDKLLSLGPSM